MNKYLLTIAWIIWGSMLVAQRPSVVTCNHLPEEDSSVFIPTNEYALDLLPAKSSTNNLCLTFLMCSDGVMTVNPTIMNSLINNCNNWLTNTHNPLPGPDYQISGYEVITMPSSVTLSSGDEIDLTIGGHSAGALLLSDVGDWKYDVGNTDIAIVVVPNNAGSGYGPGVSFAGWGQNLIGTEYGVTVFKCSSSTTVNFSTFLIPHEVFGHLQGLDFSATNPSDPAHSNQSCSGNTDFINAASNNLQICSNAADEIALADDSGDVLCLGTLPVDLISFHAQAIKNEVRIKWRVAHEHQLAGYAIERSTNGVAFAEVGWVTAHHNDEHGVQAYEYTDTRPTAASKTYYRLRMDDVDGTTTYGPMVSVLNDSDDVNIRNHVFSNTITLHVSPRTTVRHITLTDLHGRNVAGLHILAGDPITVSVPDVPAGIYWLQIRTARGIVTEKVVCVRD